MAIKISGTTVIDDSRVLTNFTDMIGTFGPFFPNSSTITTVLDFTKPLMTLTMSGNVTFTASNILAGRTAVLLLDTNTAPHTPTFPASVQFSSTPTWSGSRYWIIGFLCVSGTEARAFANGFSA